MDGVDMYCITCEQNGKSIVLKQEMAERHVAIEHGEGSFSTMKCGICHRKYYDFPHFMEHTKGSPICNIEHKLFSQEELSEQVKKCFDGLVRQMVLPRPSAPTTPTVSLNSSTPKMLSPKLENVGMEQRTTSMPRNETVERQIRIIPIVDLTEDDDDDEMENINLPPPPRIINHVPIVTSTPFRAPPPIIPPTPIGLTPIPAIRQLANSRLDGHTSTIPIQSSSSQSNTTSSKKRSLEEIPTPISSKRHTTSMVKEISSSPPELSLDSTAAANSASPNLPNMNMIATPPMICDVVTTPPQTMIKKEPQDGPPSAKRILLCQGNMDGNDGGGDKDKNRQPCENDRVAIQWEKKILDLCQLCKELDNGRPPILGLAEKETHGIIHMRYSVTFNRMEPNQVRRHAQFKRQMRMCFEEGFYEEVKRQRPRTAMRLRTR